MRQFAIDLARAPETLRAGLRVVMEEYPDRFDAMSGAPVRFEHEPDAKEHLSVSSSAPQDDAISVRYRRPIDAFRALGRLMGEADAGADANKAIGDFTETARFDLAGVMVDVSRNGVVRPETMRSLLLRYALMGLNMVILYTEDLYELPGEPMFGYLRGRYTHDEVRAIDEYAGRFGIEMFPCIQTLAHMASMLQWPAFQRYADTEQVMLADYEETYALIEKMIDAASAPYRSKRIHLGMDEAKGIGSGRYKDINGEHQPFDILNRHLGRVREICRARGLVPMIWSDMYFRIGSKTHDYYDRDAVIPPEVIEHIPEDVQLVYWDYYHLDEEFYSEWIDRHRQLGSDPVVAGGVWTWNRFWATLPFSFNAIDACIGACREKGVREVFMTMWADGGGECDIFSALPGLQYFAEQVYGESMDPDRLRANLRGSCDADFDDWVRASDLDAVPCLKDPERSNANVSKFLLWQDPFLAIMDPHLGDADLTAHYQALADDLAAAAHKGGQAQRLTFPAQIASALVLKAHLRRNMADVYHADDRQRLQQMAETEIPELRQRVEALWRRHRELWMEIYKPFGWEVVERRYGMLLMRLQTASDRLRDYLSGQLKTIPELEAELQPVFELEEGVLPVVHASRVATPSCIK